MQAHPDRIVFIDETSVKTNLTRLRGRSLLGKRLEMDAPFGAWGTQTFIAGLTHDSLIAPWVIKGAPLVLCLSRLSCDGGATARHVIYDGQWRGSDRSPLGHIGPRMSMVAPVFSFDLNGYMGFGPA